MNLYILFAMYILFKIKFRIDLIKLSFHIKLIQNLIPNKIYITNKLYINPQ